jgi:hypothetical protein
MNMSEALHKAFNDQRAVTVYLSSGEQIHGRIISLDLTGWIQMPEEEGKPTWVNLAHVVRFVQGEAPKRGSINLVTAGNYPFTVGLT